MFEEWRVVPPQLSGYVCAFHLAAHGRVPNTTPTLKSFMVKFVLHLSLHSDKNKINKNVLFGPFKNRLLFLWKGQWLWHSWHCIHNIIGPGFKSALPDIKYQTKRAEECPILAERLKIDFFQSQLLIFAVFVTSVYVILYLGREQRTTHKGRVSFSRNEKEDNSFAGKKELLWVYFD